MTTSNKQQETIFEVVGSPRFTAKSVNKVYTHAVINKNYADDGLWNFGVSFHISLKLAEAAVKANSKRYWLQFIEIAEVQEVGA